MSWVQKEAVYLKKQTIIKETRSSQRVVSAMKTFLHEGWSVIFKELGLEGTLEEREGSLVEVRSVEPSKQEGNTCM